MVNFSKDTDILKYEPVLFGELHLPWQVLTTGTGGSLSGTTFTANDADFVSTPITTGQVIYVWSEAGSLETALEIISVDSATELTVSVVRADSGGGAIAPSAATNLSYRISTFEPQANEVAFGLTEYFGIKPGDPSSNIEAEDILETSVLRQASVFAVISSVYAMLASRAEDESFWKKSLHYQKLFGKARERCRLSIDTSGDGIADVTKMGASARLVRE